MSRFPNVVLIITAVLLASLSLSFAAEREPQLIEVANVNGDGSILGALHASRPLAYSAKDEPSWLPRVFDRLKRGRSRHASLTAHILFRQKGRPTFLAVVWTDTNLRERTFDLHKVDVRSASDVRLRFVRQIEATYVNLLEPSGYDVFGDGIPTVFVSEGSGGSHRAGYRIHVIRLKRSSVDALPPGAGLPEAIYRIAGDAKTHVLSSDDGRWGGFFGTCGACGPYIPRLLRAERGGYVAACRAFPSRYRYETSASPDQPERSAADQLAVEVTAALYLIQGGFLEEGRSKFSAALAGAEKTLANDPDVEKPDELRALIDITSTEIGRAVVDASDQAACPLDSVSSGGAHPGFERRLERLR
jgi:hypothetical protein